MKKVISFDIFDTLIKRCIPSPKDLFFLDAYAGSDSATVVGLARLYAERVARKRSTKEEITIDDIYNILSSWIGKKRSQKLKEREKELEVSLCIPNKAIVDIFNKYISEGNRVILISDMYLPKDVISKMLLKCGIEGYSELYLSCEENATKSTGKLFEVVFEREGIYPASLIHYGDNQLSDIEVPARYGVTVHNVHYVKSNDLRVKKREVKTDNGKIIIGYTKAIFGDSCRVEERFGCAVFGPLLLFFSIWLRDQMLKNKLKKVYFLSRDGQIIKEAFDKLFPNEFESRYLYGSRRALIVPTLKSKDSINSMADCFALPPRMSLSNLLKRFGLSEQACSRLLSELNINSTKVLLTNDLISRIQANKKIEASLVQAIKANAKKEYIALVQYLKQEAVNEEAFALVDIGWFGNMQNSLAAICEGENWQSKIYGYYIGLRHEARTLSESPCDGEKRGFLFEPNRDEDCEEKENIFNSLFELLFVADHGSVERFDRNTLSPILLPFELDERDISSVRLLQSCAISFVEDVKKYGIDKVLHMTNREINGLLQEVGLHPSKEQARVFGELTFFDGKAEKLAKPLSVGVYLKSPKQLLNDFKKSFWRPGFLCRLFGLPINYGKLLLLIKKSKTWF